MTINYLIINFMILFYAVVMKFCYLFLYLSNIVVTLRFDVTDYIFQEDEPNPQVCVVVDMGTIVRTLPPVVASITAIPGSATGNIAS